MHCPNESFLKLFSCDPDAALADAPGFEDHLAECLGCQAKLEIQATQLPRGQFEELVFGTSDRQRPETPIIPGYQLHEAIGAGGFGTVYRGTHIASGRPVAVKLLSHVAPDQWRRIVLERETLVQCDHPNIVTLLDYGPFGAGCFFVYRWMIQSLADVIAKPPLIRIDQAANWMIQITDGVATIHALGIIHRDLKPSNLLLSASRTPKLIDFGIAKVLDEKQSEATTSIRAGTPGYMAPEQTGRTNHSVSYSTDVYGLGAVLYAMLTNRPPFAGNDVTQILECVVNTTPVEPRKLRSDVPKDLEIICMKCLAKEPNDRYASCAELKADLERFVTNEPILARPLSTLSKISRYALRHPAVTALLAVLLLLPGAFVALSLQAERRLSEQRETIATQDVIKQIASSSTKSLPQVLADADNLPELALSAGINTFLQSNAATPTVSLRCLALRNNTHIDTEMSSSTVVNDIVHLPIDELAILCARPAFQLSIQKIVGYESLQKEVLEARADQHRLNLAVCLAYLHSDWSEWSTVAPKIASTLATRPLSEAMVWSQVFESVKNELHPPLAILSSESDTAMEIAWQWSVDSPEKIVELIPRLSLKAIRKLKELPAANACDVRDSLIAQWNELLVLRKQKIQPRETNTRLHEFLREYGGAVTTSRGMVVRVPQHDSKLFLDELATNGYSLTTIDPYEAENKPFFAATFEISEEPFEIDWAIPATEIESKIHSNRLEGWEPIYFRMNRVEFANDPPPEPKSICVLWRKGAWEPSRWLDGLEESWTALNDATSSDSNTIQKEYQRETFNRADMSPGAYGLQTEKRIPRRDESKRRAMLIDNIASHESKTFPSQRSIELLVGTDSYLQSIHEAERFENGVQKLLTLGYEPIELTIVDNGQKIRCLWRGNLGVINDNECEKKASFALALWTLGSPAILLKSLDEIREPSLRTKIAESLGHVESDAERWIDTLRMELTPLQIQGLLIALMDWRNSQFENHAARWKVILEQLWEHPDSGVHFAADHLLRTSLNLEPYSIVRQDLCTSHGLEKMAGERNWYYGPFGLPFVVFGSISETLVGADERIAWHTSTDRRLGDMKRRFAICAIETPQWLTKQLQGETGLTFSDRNWVGDEPGDEPVVGFTFKAVLQVCRILTEKEHVELTDINLPTIDRIGIGLRLPTDFLEKEGYRVPSNQEWEIACRAGSWTASFLGDSMEFITEYSWSSANSEQKPSRVASKKPNPHGLFDVLGNVYEAVLGEAMSSEQFRSLEHWELNEKCPLNLRGGSYLSNRIYCSSGSNHHIFAQQLDINSGFRLVRPILPAKSKE